LYAKLKPLKKEDLKMEKRGKIAVIVTLAVAFCFLLVSLAQSTDTVGGKIWAITWLKNVYNTVSIPIWQITQDGTSLSVRWANHAPNPRFAIYDPGTPGNNSDDLVLDKETGLVWARDANLEGGTKTWQDAITSCRWLLLGNRQGWRLPTVEELSSLAYQGYFPRLPTGHPFISVQDANYWSSTTYESDSSQAWGMHTHLGIVWTPTDEYYVWPVRGGNGYATGNW